MIKKNWIAGAIKEPGAFTRKAKHAGKSVASYARQVLKPSSKATQKTKRQARLAMTLKNIAQGQ